jgi:hypothetical protein
MPTDDPKSKEEPPWEDVSLRETQKFAYLCAALRDSNPHDEPALEYMMAYFATELWDRGISQLEIKAAFEKAIRGLGPYAAGEERRSDRR